jgi:hypothetical protein
MWGCPTPFLSRQLQDLRTAIEELADGLEVLDRSNLLGALVGSLDLRTLPVHRWYYYKEGFSPHLPRLLLDELGAGASRVVLDPFAGVGTTLLALQTHPGVSAVLGAEHSPFAHFVAMTKLGSLGLDPRVLRHHADRLVQYRTDFRHVSVPSLSSFANEKIFDRRSLYDLLGAKDAITSDPILNERERAFFLLGLAAIVEDVSGAMKDGRALRIRNGRRRRPNALTPTAGASAGTDVRTLLRNQWLAMAEDFASWTAGCDGHRPKTTVARGDARNLLNLAGHDGRPLLDKSSVGLALFSPPYLNCVDYTEVYKLELWLLGLVESHEEFRTLRQGTLRSHPSITFPDRRRTFDGRALVFDIVDSLSEFLEAHLSRPPVGRMVAHYFDDMYEVFVQLARVVEPGGRIACVVANSTFSRRADHQASQMEVWRVPILTDLLLARLAELAGFDEIQLWTARQLRPRNITDGTARESIVVARKPQQ